MQDFTGNCNLLCIICIHTDVSSRENIPEVKFILLIFFLRCFLFTCWFCHYNKSLVFCLLFNSTPFVLVYLLMCKSNLLCLLWITENHLYKGWDLKQQASLLKLPTRVQRYCLCVHMQLYPRFQTLNLSTHCLQKILCAFILSFDSKLTITLFNFKLHFPAAVSENR